MRIPSENPPGVHYAECVARIEEELASLRLTSTRLANGLVVEARHGTSRRPLYFSGHYDVVPHSVSGQFDPRIEDGKIYGRGTADMKGGIAAMMYAVAALAESGAQLDGHVVLRCVPDEETGGRRGTATLLEERQIRRDALGMLTAEPTGGVVWNASRGAITWRITALGRAAHVGLQHRGVNAFDAIVALANELTTLRNEISGRETSHSVGEEGARASILLIGGEVNGGSNFNVVPESCTITLDRRTNPEEQLERERDRLLECVERVRSRGAKLSVEVIQEAPPSETRTDCKLAVDLGLSIGEVTGARPRFELCPGLLETRFYSTLGVPALAYGPGDLGVAHGPNEHIVIDRLLETAVVYACTAAHMLAPS